MKGARAGPVADPPGPEEQATHRPLPCHTPWVSGQSWGEGDSADHQEDDMRTDDLDTLLRSADPWAGGIPRR